MPVTGRKPKPEGEARNRNQKAHEWMLVADRPFRGQAPKLPTRRLDGKPWPALTKRWWTTIRAMPHCVLWSASDWQFALDTALVAAEFHDGDTRIATELRNREKILGTTVDFRRDLRIRYVDPAELPTKGGAKAGEVTSLDDYRDRLG